MAMGWGLGLARSSGPVGLMGRMVRSPLDTSRTGGMVSPTTTGCPLTRFLVSMNSGRWTVGTKITRDYFAVGTTLAIDPSFVP